MPRLFASDAGRAASARAVTMNFLNTLRSWLMPQHDGAVPTAGGFDIDAILSRRETSKRLARCVAFLPEIEEAVLAETVRVLLDWIGDLPASEAHHHRDAFGLFDHLLDVSERALRKALSENFADSTSAWPEEQAYRVPRLRLATWSLALLHDLGKIASLRVHGPRRALWNPFVEPISAFYARFGRTNCTLSWVAGRGMDPHVWLTATLQGRVMPPGLLSALGPKVFAEALDCRTPASKLVGDMISKADQESAREWMLKRAEEERDERRRELPVSPLVGVPDWVERVPRILAEAAADGVLRANDPAGDLWITAEQVLLRYPRGVVKLARLVHDAVGRESIEVRSLAANEQGARLLADALHRRRWLLHDPESDGWKLHARIALGDATESTAVIVLHRVFVEPALAALGPVISFDGEIALSRSANGKPMPGADRSDAAAVAVPAIESRQEPDSSAEPVTEAAPIAGAPIPTPPVVVKAMRRFISSETLLDDIRDAMVQGTIPTNEWNGQAFLLGDVTYLVSPRGFERLVEAGLYDRDPRREANLYLDALGKLACVRKREGGRVLTSIVVRPGARPTWAVAFETAGLFRSQRLVIELGYWSQSPIREISEEEHRAILKALSTKSPDRKEARDAV